MRSLFGIVVATLLITAAAPVSAVTMVGTTGTPLSEMIKTNSGSDGNLISYFSDPSNLQVDYSSTSTLHPSSTGGFAFVEGANDLGFTNLTLTPQGFTFSDLKFNIHLPAKDGGPSIPNGYKTDFTFDTTVYFTGAGSPVTFNNAGGNGENRFLITGGIGEAISKVVFSNLVGTSTKNNAQTFVNAYNFDSLRQTSFDAISGVPEPSTWALFILGFGAIGMMLRSGRGLARIRA